MQSRWVDRDAKAGGRPIRSGVSGSLTICALRLRVLYEAVLAAIRPLVLHWGRQHLAQDPVLATFAGRESSVWSQRPRAPTWLAAIEPTGLVAVRAWPLKEDSHAR